MSLIWYYLTHYLNKPYTLALIHHKKAKLIKVTNTFFFFNKVINTRIKKYVHIMSESNEAHNNQHIHENFENQIVSTFINDLYLRW